MARAWCQMTTTNGLGGPTSACDRSGIPLEWTQPCLSYAINPGARDFLDPRAREIIQESFGAWQRITCDGADLDFSVRLLDEPAACDLAVYNSEGGNANIVGFVADWAARQHDPSAYALTTVWHHTGTGEIFDADMEINEERGTYAECPSPDGCNDGRIDLQNVVTHEVGHFFGVGHSDVPTASMFGTSPPGEVSKRILRTDDVEAMCSIYPPGSLSSECDYTPHGGLILECVGDAGCCAVAGGRSSNHTALMALLGAFALLVFRRRA